MNFDDVLPAVVGACEEWPEQARLKKIAVLRDLRGKLRLVIDSTDPDPSTGPNALDHASLLAQLKAHLTTRLGDWFTGEVLSTRAGDTSLRGVATRILDHLAPAWPSPRWRDALGTERQADPARWRLWERRMGKHPWLEGRLEPPWPDDQPPTVVTFFSFKGGVGRTTTLAACALQAARAGEKVAVVDLDLEAPGVGSLFGIQPDRGVLDLLVEHHATGKADVRSIHQRAREPAGDLTDLIEVFPAGRLDANYLEKLARLDFSSALPGGVPPTTGAVPTIPVREALLALLEGIRDEIQPRWIFLDARAGLHDLAGLSLHGLAHLDVLFSRANTQGLAGLDLVLGAVARRQRDAAARLCLVHAMAPVAVADANAEQERMAAQTHAMFLRHHLYSAQPPEQHAPDADHHPWTVKRVEAIERNDRLTDIVRDLDGDDYQKIWARIRLLTIDAQPTAPPPPVTS